MEMLEIRGHGSATSSRHCVQTHRIKIRAIAIYEGGEPREIGGPLAPLASAKGHRIKICTGKPVEEKSRHRVYKWKAMNQWIRGKEIKAETE